METVVNGLANVIVYIDDLLVHSATHAEHIAALDQDLQRLVQHNIKINLQKCFFGSKEVSYLGFHLTEQGILPGTDKLKAVKNTPPPPKYTRYGSFWDCATSFDVMCRTLRRLPPRSPLLPKKSALGRAGHYLLMP
jgi:hypothetical protein